MQNIRARVTSKGAVYADRDFLWRLSSATVELDESDFTPLPAYDRVISTLRGDMVLSLIPISGYFVMQLFVFTYSLGDHMVMPIRDAIAMDLADEGKTGTFLGRYRGMMTLGSMLASALVFVGFRVGFFYFRTGVIPSFCAALVFLVVALALLCRLRKTLPALDVRKRSGERRRLPVRRRYLPYYIVTAVYGFQDVYKRQAELIAVGTEILLGNIANAPRDRGSREDPDLNKNPRAK